MAEEVYERLAEALDRLPNGFPRTPSNVEIKILKRIFSEEEADLASQLSGKAESIDAIGERVGLSTTSVEKRLTEMANRGLLWTDEKDGTTRFRLAPFIVGIYESQRDNMDHEFAHLMENYLTNGGAVGIMKPEPALHRVVPAQRAVKTEWILPYDDVRAILLNAKSFRISDCICRLQQDKIGRRCTFPLRTCLGFSSAENPPGPNSASKEEALAFLDKMEEIGLVHTVSNVMKGVGYVCNCCGCCCGILRGITDWGIENSVAHANYYAVIDPEQCTDCGTCRDRCQVKAISEQDGVSVVDTNKCIGCGLCVTGCPNNVARLELKPRNEIINPPLDFAAWERDRLRSRHLHK